MGIHLFTKAKHLQVELSEFELKEIAAKRMINPNMASFDSSLAYSLPLMVGFHPKTLRLELIHSDKDGKKYNVYGASEEGATDSIKGVVLVKSAERWRQEMEDPYAVR